MNHPRKLLGMMAATVRMKPNWAIARPTPIKRLLWMVLGVILALWPLPAMANGGTALMWTGLLHLLIGNLIIGYIEAGFLSRLFHTPRLRSTEMLIIANYASAWAGAFLLVGRLDRYFDITIDNMRIWLGIAAILAFLLTLLVEYPFFWFLLRQRKQAIQTALKATLLIHGISYLLLFGWYSSNSYNLLTQVSPVPITQLQPSSEYTLHFLSADGTQAFQSDLTGSNIEVGDRATFDAFIPDQPIYYRSVPQPTESTDWEFYMSRFETFGRNRVTQTQLILMMHTPFIHWSNSHATHLPGDWLVFQLGQDQICLLHADSRRVALIARGKHPVVVGSDGSVIGQDVQESQD
jgi:hypothetical protein